MMDAISAADRRENDRMQIEQAINILHRHGYVVIERNRIRRYTHSDMMDQFSFATIDRKGMADDILLRAIETGGKAIGLTIARDQMLGCRKVFAEQQVGFETDLTIIASDPKTRDRL